MEDINNFLRKFNVHKSALEKNYKVKSKEQICQEIRESRKESRETLLLKKRNIGDLSPFTPEPRGRARKSPEKKASVAPVNNRLELLKKWKEAKEKQKAEEKRKAKPIFKVYHVNEPVGNPNLENVNRQIKGKPIKSKFAPLNHKFQAPKNIKPISLEWGQSASQKEPIVEEKHTQNKTKTKQTKAGSSKSYVSKKSPLKITKPSLRSAGNKKLVRQNAVEIDGMKETTKTRSKNFTMSSKPQIRLQETMKPTNKLSPSSKLAPRTSNTVQQNLNPKTPEQENEKEVLYSDDEISMRTPSRISTARKPSAKLTPFSRKLALDSMSSPEVTPKRTPSRQEASRPSNNQDNGEVSGNRRTPRGTSKSAQGTLGQRKSIMKQNEPIEGDAEEVEGVQDTLPPRINTPVLKPRIERSPTYISPFVTISRGKDSARKEFKQRQSTGGTFFPNAGRTSLSITNPQAAADYFTKILDDEIRRIQGICAKWEAYKSDDLPEEAHDMINVVLGHSTLLITKKFQQFRSLIEECRSCQYKEKPITCHDLHGFWDLAYIQVEDLEKRFGNLDRLKDSNWIEVLPDRKVGLDQKVVSKRGRGRPKKQAATSGIKNFLRTARNKKKETEENAGGDSTSDLVIPERPANLSVNERLQELTPARQSVVLPSGTSTGRRSLRVSLLNGQDHKNRLSSSPGLTMMRISQAIKSGDGITPSKSILKIAASRSEKCATKSVVFRDQLEDDSRELPRHDKENRDSGNVSYTTPVKTRRSRRLAAMTDT